VFGKGDLGLHGLSEEQEEVVLAKHLRLCGARMPDD
jgi:hypothetical protein